MARKTTMTDVARAAAARRLGLDRALSFRPHRMLRVAVLIQAPRNPFHAALREGIETAARLYADLNLQFLVHPIDPNDPKAIVGLLARKAVKADGLILTLPDEPRIAAAVGAVGAVAANRPVVTLATDLPASGRAAYVGPDDRRAGHMVLDALAADASNRGVYHLSAGARLVVDALRKLGRTVDTALVTHELTEDRRALLRERGIAAVIDRQPELEAGIAVETSARLLGRMEGPTGSTETKFVIHMPEKA